MIQIQRLHPKAQVPFLGTALSAGLDLCVLEGGWLWPFAKRRFRTGLAVALPAGSFGHITTRSSSFTRGMDADGTIDADYRGEVLLQLRNTRPWPLRLYDGERVAQMKVSPYLVAEVRETFKLPASGRGTAGFGSTGR